MVMHLHRWFSSQHVWPMCMGRRSWRCILPYTFNVHGHMHAWMHVHGHLWSWTYGHASLVLPGIGHEKMVMHLHRWFSSQHVWPMCMGRRSWRCILPYTFNVHGHMHAWMHVHGHSWSWTYGHASPPVRCGIGFGVRSLRKRPPVGPDSSSSKWQQTCEKFAPTAENPSLLFYTQFGYKYLFTRSVSLPDRLCERTIVIPDSIGSHSCLLRPLLEVCAHCISCGFLCQRVNVSIVWLNNAGFGLNMVAGIGCVNGWLEVWERERERERESLGTVLDGFNLISKFGHFLRFVPIGFFFWGFSLANSCVLVCVICLDGLGLRCRDVSCWYAHLLQYCSLVHLSVFVTFASSEIEAGFIFGHRLGWFQLVSRFDHFLRFVCIGFVLVFFLRWLVCASSVWMDWVMCCWDF